jgi:5-methylcytosine-specific restriction endonuclease McrA
MAVRPCIERGCPEYTTGTRCVKHQAAREARRRADPDLTGRRGSTWTWRKARARRIAHDHHTCQRCRRHETTIELLGGHLEVHHRDGNPAHNEMTNLETVCAGPGGRFCHTNAKGDS